MAIDLSKFIEYDYQQIIDGKRRKIPWPWALVTSLCPTLLPGTLTVIAGAPGSSKSFMMLQCLQFWIKQNVRVAYMMLEGSRDIFLRRCVAQMTKNANHMDNDWVEEHPGQALKEMRSFAEELDDVSNCIDDGTLLHDVNYGDVKLFLDRESMAGARILIIDPITSADGQGHPWIVDKDMVMFCQGIARKHGTSIILVTHPAKSGVANSKPSLDALSGGAAFSRHVDGVLWLEKFQSKSLNILGACGTLPTDCDRILHLLKVKDGRGQGTRLGFNFRGEDLLLAEQGIVVKETKP